MYLARYGDLQTTFGEDQVEIEIYVFVKCCDEISVTTVWLQT